MGHGCFGKLFWRALFLVGAAAAAFGMTRDDQPFPTRLMTVAGIFAVLFASCALSHLRLQQALRAEAERSEEPD
jgi:hypothetical protein